MRVLFWGTPEFATPSLRALAGEGFDVVGVVTQPDRPRGRSRSVLVAPPVKEIALAEGVPVLQPERPRGGAFMAQLRELEPEISVVVAYGHILKREVIDLPPLGTVNVHASLLPALRGAAPIHAAIRRGYTETGVTIMQMVEELDAGPMLHQMRTPVADDTTFGELALRLSELGALALVQALALLSMGAVQPISQDHAAATYAPKVTRADANVAWSADAQEVSRTIRAYDPVPGAFTRHRGSELKLFGARVADEINGQPGAVMELGETMLVACGTGGVRVVQVQPAGRRRIGIGEWARGRGVVVGDIFAE
ncbi:MAG TPA: methionyl-tRNA formyltransferase [Gemmatimonadaceae bacterium]|nr:methionyl-tRNA formyltransferase [Gemmatimonadaceae bacterium]